MSPYITLLSFCFFYVAIAPCPDLNELNGQLSDGTPGCFSCVSAGCSYCSVTGGSTLYGCVTPGTTTCAGSGDSPTFISNPSCDCPHYLDHNIKFAESGITPGKMKYYLADATSSSISFQVYSVSVDYSLNVYALEDGQCPTTSSSLPATATQVLDGWAKQINFQMGKKYNILVVATSTGIEESTSNFEKGKMFVTICTNASCTAPCDGHCPASDYCHDVNGCESGCIGNVYTCCPTGQPYTFSACIHVESTSQGSTLNNCLILILVVVLLFLGI